MAAGKDRGTAYVVEGGGPPVVLVHGMGLNRDMWNWQLPALVPRFRVVRYDLVGHGESDPPADGCSMDDLVRQLDRLLDHLQLDRCALVGFSLGGLIVRAYALRHPHRVTALAVLNSAHNRTEAERAAMRERLERATRLGHVSTIDAALERWFTKGFAARHPEVLDRVRRWMEANDPAVYPKVYRVLAESDAALRTAISAIRCPTLVLACDEDHGNSPDMARRMGALIPDARTVILPGLRHMALAEHPEAVSEALVPFLEETLGVK